MKCKIVQHCSNLDGSKFDRLLPDAVDASTVQRLAGVTEIPSSGVKIDGKTIDGKSYHAYTAYPSNEVGV